ncbi:MAG TPA: NAD(+) synthase [Clostridia bacterium]|nr:NAD(+) synthase [Clostridia bacterium]
MKLMDYGYVRCAAAVPQIKVGDPNFNAEEIIKLLLRGADEGISVMAFPELCVTGYTCGDLFHQSALLDTAENALCKILAGTKLCPVLAAVGLPVRANGALFNCAAVFYKGKLLGVVPKSFLPNYNEFYEKRWFSPASVRRGDTVSLCSETVPFSERLLFQSESSALCVGVEICEDLWVPVPPSSYHALCGANVFINLSASDEAVTKADFRRDIIRMQSAKCFAAYIYSSAGQWESTTDLVFSGHCVIAENGGVINESIFPEDSSYMYADADVDRLCSDRRKFLSFSDGAAPENYRVIRFADEGGAEAIPHVAVNPYPFVPQAEQEKSARCAEIFRLQSTGLYERMRKTGIRKAVIGVSGGLDSTLALLVAADAVKRLDLSPENLVAITMPGPGTTARTKQNALTLMRELHASMREISIEKACLQHFEDIGHDPDIHDVTYENTQARERTQILMDVANQCGGLVVGTGDMSELALGWCTYNGDHMSHYAVNAGVPKTLVRHLVRWYAETTENKKLAATLFDVLDTPVSPELLPADSSGNITQKTEDEIGPYELHDFFLYNMVRNGFPPKKILFLAALAFRGAYTEAELKTWLTLFYKRFFASQFKRSCLPDGVKVGSVCLSPRGDWRMPSDASRELWLQELAAAKEE